jgi:hypothetical protein
MTTNVPSWGIHQKTAILLVATLTLFTSAAEGRKRIKPEEPTATLSFVVVRDVNGKPVRNASVVLHPVNKDDKQERGGLELKTDADGKCSLDGIPYGKLRIQVLATGFQTFGNDYDVDQPAVDITVKMKRPAGQYSIYEDHPAEKPPETNEQPQKPQ